MRLEVQADNVVKRFGERELFSIQRLYLGEGERLHLSGENGAGKTTLMKILAGLDRPCEGQVRITPKARRWWSDRIHPAVIYLHQTPYLFAGSVEDNVSYGLKLRRCASEVRRKRTRDALTWARLDHLATQPAHSLSGGEKQRLALARAWILEPKLMFLDEPTANLDSHSVTTVAGLVEELVHTGTTVMISSHQENAVTALCTRRLSLAQGRLYETGFTDEAPYVQH